MTRTNLMLSLAVSGVFAQWVTAQRSSLIAWPDMEPRTQNAPAGNGSGALLTTINPEDKVLPMTRAIERVSLIAIPAQHPRKYKVQDLITIIVRQQKKYEADAEMETQKKWNITSKLSEWFRFYPDAHLGTDHLSNGQPGAQFDFDNKYKTEGQNDREDRFITRITARIIDVKPNGNLVLEARTSEQHDEEVSEVTVTGICRGDDVTPDNTVLSTQLADLTITEDNKGAVRDATTRGWAPKILDFAKPF